MPKVVTPEEWNRRAAAAGVEWIGETPTKSAAKYPARCRGCGKEWEVEANSVTKGHGCRRCAGVARRVTREEWDEGAESASMRWVGADPIVSSRKYPAICATCEHEWLALPKDVARGHGCPACSGNIPGEPGVSREEWDKRAKAVNVEWVGNEPLLALTKHAARCTECGYEWTTRPSDIHRGSGCPACVGLARISQEEWAERAARAGIEWIGDEPVRKTYRHAARCLTCEHEYTPWPEVVARGSGCPACAAEAQRIKSEEFVRRAREMGFEWLGDEPIRGGHKRAARCLECEHTWEVNPSAGTGCPACAPNARVPQEEWRKRAAAIGIRWIGEEPVRSSRKHRAQCEACAHEWMLSPKEVTSGEARCQVCAERARQEEWHRRAAARRIEWIGEDPIRALVRHPARCTQCGREWAPVPSQITWFGCQACAKPGFDPSSPGTVYLIHHHSGPYMKVGITGADPSKRLNGWMDLGWEVLGAWALPVGRDALDIERTVVAWWKESGARRCTRDELPMGQGWTESVHIGVAADEPRTLEFIESLVLQFGGGA